MRDPSVFHALVLMHLLSASALWALLRPGLRAAAVLAVVAVGWIIWNGPIEGAVLVSFTPTMASPSRTSSDPSRF